MGSKTGAPFGKLFESVEISSHQRLLLRAGPPLDLALGCNGINDLIEIFAIYKDNRPPLRRKPGIMAGLMFSHTPL